MSVKRLLPLLLICGCGAIGEPPSVEIGERPYQKLTWDDFQLTDSLPSGMSAQTGTYMRWGISYQVTRSSGGYTAILTKVTIESGINRENCFRVRDVPARSLDLLLAHEQLHYDLNEIYAQRLRTLTLNEWGTGFGPSADAAGEDLSSQVDSKGKAVLDDLQIINDQYDSETQHGTVVDAQQRWADEIADQLKLIVGS